MNKQVNMLGLNGHSSRLCPMSRLHRDVQVRQPLHGHLTHAPGGLRSGNHRETGRQQHGKGYGAQMLHLCKDSIFLLAQAQY